MNRQITTIRIVLFTATISMVAYLGNRLTDSDVEAPPLDINHPVANANSGSVTPHRLRHLREHEDARLRSTTRKRRRRRSHNLATVDLDGISRAHAHALSDEEAEDPQLRHENVQKHGQPNMNKEQEDNEEEYWREVVGSKPSGDGTYYLDLPTVTHISTVAPARPHYIVRSLRSQVKPVPYMRL